MGADAARPSPVVDAQVHVWRPETAERPWPVWGQEYRRKAHRPELSTETLLSEMSQAGVDRAVLVPPMFEGYRNDYAAEAARAWPTRFRVMARLDLGAPDLIGQLDDFAADPLVAGIRLVFLPIGAGHLGDARQSKVWAAAAERGLPVMLHCPGQLAELEAIARAHPALRLAVDHLGLSGLHSDAAAGAEVQPLLALAQTPRISVKLSALPCYSTEPYPHQALLGTARTVVQAFGADRVFWGSDLSRLPGRYRDAVSMVRDHLGLSPQDTSQVLGASLLSWLRWPD